MKANECRLPILADDDDTPRRTTLWAMLPALAAAVAIGILCYRQVVLGVPVPVIPLSGDVVAGPEMHLEWNKFSDEDTVAHVQLVVDDPTFTTPYFETMVPNAYRIIRPNVLKPHSTYYWRMRTVRNGRSSPWTRTIRFRTE